MDNSDNKNYIKSLVTLNGTTLKKVAEQMQEVLGKKYSCRALYGKLNRDSLTLAEFQLMADILGYKIELVRK